MSGKTERYVRGKCKNSNCGATVRFAIGDLSVEEVQERLKHVEMYECPGGPHTELGNMFDGYEWDWAVVEGPALPSDTEWVEELKREGYRVLCGAYGKCTEFPSIHDIKGLEHIGFGDFESATHIYRRRDSPAGTRFYLEIPKGRAGVEDDGDHA